MELRINHWGGEDPSNQLRPEIDKVQFDKLTSWELGWFLLEPISKAENDDHEIELVKRFSGGQKALYFFWYLDGQVTNGGFIQFYWNGYDKYLPVIKEGLKLVGDKVLLEIVDSVENEFLLNIKEFIKQREVDDWEPLYENLTKFEELDSLYYEIHDKTMSLIEKYAREHPNEFGSMK